MIIVKGKTPTPTIGFDTYWRFAKSRQDIFFARYHAQPKPWCQDPVLAEYKFTNVYRACDRVSQYLIASVIYNQTWSYPDTFLRVMLFKLFNKIDTWQLLERHFGEISLTTFDVDAYDKVLQQALDKGQRIYSAAYIMPSGSVKKYGKMRKHRFHLELLASLLRREFHLTLQDSQSMKSGFIQLLSVDSIGKFLAYQLITDLNYSRYFDFSEGEFVMPGPGALDGIKKCFSSLNDYTPADTIHWMMDQQQHHFARLGLTFKTLWGRDMQLIDGQNVFCEVDKYCRVAHPELAGISGRSRIKQKFSQTTQGIKWCFPPKWQLNLKQC